MLLLGVYLFFLKNVNLLLVNLTLGGKDSTLNSLHFLGFSQLGGSYSAIQAVESSGLHNIKCY